MLKIYYPYDYFLLLCRKRYIDGIKNGHKDLKDHYKKQFLAEIKYLKKTFKGKQQWRFKNA